MKRRVISMVALKGGAGKSTLSVAIACEWANRGVRTLVVDLDEKQRSVLKWDRRREALKVTTGPSVMAAGENLAHDFAHKVAAYEVVIIDTPGTLGKLPIGAMGLSDLVVMPCGPNGIESESMEETFKEVSSVMALRPKLEAAILITKRQTNTVVGREARAAYEDSEFDVMRVELDYRLDYGQAHDAGMGPTTWEPSGKAADEVRTLVDELEERLRMHPKRTKAERRGVLRAV